MPRHESNNLNPMATNSDLNYIDIESFVKWISSNLAGIISNDAINDYSVDDEQEDIIGDALFHAESKIDGFLRERGYATPIDSSYEKSIQVITIYIYNIAVYELYGRRGITKERYYKYTRTMEEVKGIGDGSTPLPDDLPKRNKSGIVHGHKFGSAFSRNSKIGGTGL